MSYIAEAQGIWYEGSSSWLRLMQQHPLLLPIRFVGHLPDAEMLFREEYFNSATRIRRGWLYERTERFGWGPGCVSRHPLREYNNHNTGLTMSKAYKAAECSVRNGWTAILGDNNAQSHWTVVFAERAGLDAHYLTLKSKTYFGVLPEVNRDVIPEANRQDILRALDAVVEAAPIQAPQPVIDACRNAACHMISAQFPESNSAGKKDLGELVTWLLNEGKLKSCTDAAGTLVYLLEVSSSHLIARLHSRAKANAAAQHGTRPVSQQDANLAVDAIAFLLQDFGWAETMA
ncbi:hypothetical protein [Acidiferrobacter thiooxydans]|uniref:Uncharacterized protein n=1 Tax=Acidiferrobacter thiooxydans TaxID=163359 RepID=A0A368HIA9_9GAMM|nr:hypothetical protein [Acidiferrobacter thiooxydans]RCN59116.1 hypothetical protein C4900_05165 [Acidiferrobacter thiooxydans]